MSEHRFEVRQEEDVVPGRTLVRVGVSAVVISVLAVVVSTALLGRSGQAKLGGGPAQRVEKYGNVAPPAIGLVEQTLIEHEERGLVQRRVEEARLGEYGWVDRGRGIAHIPIERAMAKVVNENRADGGEDGGAR
jgi:hypothetical protein